MKFQYTIQLEAVAINFLLYISSIYIYSFAQKWKKGRYIVFSRILITLDTQIRNFSQKFVHNLVIMNTWKNNWYLYILVGTQLTHFFSFSNYPNGLILHFRYKFCCTIAFFWTMQTPQILFQIKFLTEFLIRLYSVNFEKYKYNEFALKKSIFQKESIYS